MKMHALLLLTAGWLVAADNPKDDAVKDEMAKFQGAWKFVSMEVGGTKKPDADFAKYTVVLNGDQWTVSEGNKIAAQIKFKVDPTREPKTIDLIDADKKRLIRGIYSFKGDTLTVCDRGAEKGERPAAFGTKPDSGLVQFVLQRSVTDQAKKEAVRQDRKKYEGTWRVVSLTIDGNQAADEDARKITVINHAETWIVLVDGKEVVRGTRTIDPTKKPKTIDFTPSEGDSKGKLFLGIYDIGESTRKLCFAPPGKDRPPEFASKLGLEHFLVVFEREQKERVGSHFRP
jgi:uncharacterized protein (TIGR03067 family)